MVHNFMDGRPSFANHVSAVGHSWLTPTQSSRVWNNICNNCFAKDCGSTGISRKITLLIGIGSMQQRRFCQTVDWILKVLCSVKEIIEMVIHKLKNPNIWVEFSRLSCPPKCRLFALWCKISYGVAIAVRCVLGLGSIYPVVALVWDMLYLHSRKLRSTANGLTLLMYVWGHSNWNVSRSLSCLYIFRTLSLPPSYKNLIKKMSHLSPFEVSGCFEETFPPRNYPKPDSKLTHSLKPSTSAQPGQM